MDSLTAELAELRARLLGVAPAASITKLDGRLTELRAELEQLTADLSTLSQQAAEREPFNADPLTEKIAALEDKLDNLPPIEFVQVDPRTGAEINRVEKRLGETLQLKFGAGDRQDFQPAR